jgi:hypothetical protein
MILFKVNNYLNSIKFSLNVFFDKVKFLRITKL